MRTLIAASIAAPCVAEAAGAIGPATNECPAERRFPRVLRCDSGKPLAPAAGSR